MARLSLRGASRIYDVSRAGLQAALLSGKVSGARDERGDWSIDTSELARVFRARSPGDKTVTQDGEAEGGSPAPRPDPTELHELRAKLARAEAEVETLKLQARLERAETAAAALALERDLLRQLVEAQNQSLADLRRLATPAIPGPPAVLAIAGPAPASPPALPPAEAASAIWRRRARVRPFQSRLAR